MNDKTHEFGIGRGDGRCQFVVKGGYICGEPRSAPVHTEVPEPKSPLGNIRLLHQAVEGENVCTYCKLPMDQWLPGTSCHAREIREGVRPPNASYAFPSPEGASDPPELQPCPFCLTGGKPWLWESRDPKTNNRVVWCVACESCACEGPEADAEQAAIKAWNTRADLATSVPGSREASATVDEDLAAMMERCDGPKWKISNYRPYGLIERDPDESTFEYGDNEFPFIAVFQQGTLQEQKARAERIVFAVNNLPRVIKELVSTRAENERLRKLDAQSRASGCWCDEHGNPCKACSDKQELSARLAEAEAEIARVKGNQ